MSHHRYSRAAELARNVIETLVVSPGTLRQRLLEIDREFLCLQIGIYLAREPVDLRIAHDGLLAIVGNQFGDDPFDGSVFLFLNRRRGAIGPTGRW